MKVSASRVSASRGPARREMCPYYFRAFQLWSLGQWANPSTTAAYTLGGGRATQSAVDVAFHAALKGVNETESVVASGEGVVNGNVTRSAGSLPRKRMVRPRKYANPYKDETRGVMRGNMWDKNM